MKTGNQKNKQWAGSHGAESTDFFIQKMPFHFFERHFSFS
jgi:hypothetical protein